MSATDNEDARVTMLRQKGVRRARLHWADNNGIIRTRLVSMDGLASSARRGLGASLLLAVFDSHDAVAHGSPYISTASGDQRLVPDLDSVRVAGSDPNLAYVAVDQRRADGTASVYDSRAALIRQIVRAESIGLHVLVGYELEFTLLDQKGRPAHHGPAYSPSALDALGTLPADLLDAFAQAGIGVDQVHAEYGDGQLEVSLAATSPLRAADDQIVARAIVRDVARQHALRASFAPLTSLSRPGNGAHVHISLWDQKTNLFAPTGDGSDVHGLGPRGAHALAGLLRDVGALAAVAAPSSPSLIRLRPGYFAGSYAFWGLENRDAPLRVAEGGELLGDGYWNVEFRSSDASGNPHLVIAALIASSLAGLEEELDLDAPHADDPHGWSDDERRARGVAALPDTAEAREHAIDSSPAVLSVFTREHREAFRAVRRSDAGAASSIGDQEIVRRHLWLY